MDSSEASKAKASVPLADFATLSALPHRSHFAPSTLRLTIEERRVLLSVLDILLLFSALIASLAAFESHPFSWPTIVQMAQFFVVLTVIWAAWSTFFDSYDLSVTTVTHRSAWSAARAALLSTLTYLAIPYWPPHFSSVLSSGLFVLLGTIAVPMWRVLYTVILSRSVFQQRLLIVGAGDSGRELARALDTTCRLGGSKAALGMHVVGFVDDDPDKIDRVIESVPVIGNPHDLIRLVQERGIDTVVVAISSSSNSHPELFQALLDLAERHIDIESMHSLYERATGRIPVRHIGLQSVVPQSTSLALSCYQAIKRVVDILVSALMLLPFALTMPVVALANAIWSPGPLLYRQVRVGKGGRPFWILKFRSMIPAAERSTGAVWASLHDTRITSVGRFLRLTSLDDLPQVMNVLKGEMSLIGPQAERPEFVSRLVREVPYYQVRHCVRPGITGWAQVNYRYGSSTDDTLVKLEYDLYYIKHRNFLIEASILVKTMARALGLRGR